MDVAPSAVTVFPTAAIFPSRISTCPGASVSPEMVCTVAPESRKVSARAAIGAEAIVPARSRRLIQQVQGLRVVSNFRHLAKAVEDNRTPRRSALSGAWDVALASWTAPVLWRFGRHSKDKLKRFASFAWTRELDLDSCILAYSSTQRRSHPSNSCSRPPLKKDSSPPPPPPSPPPDNFSIFFALASRSARSFSSLAVRSGLSERSKYFFP